MFLGHLIGEAVTLPVPYTRDWRPLFEGKLAGKRTPTASSPGEPTT